MSDARIMRGRQESAASAVRRLTTTADHGSEAMLVQTRIQGSYPTIATSFFACTPLRIDGPETEGAAVTFFEDSSHMVMAFNLGSTVPPVGTKLIIHSSGGRWAFRYDG